MSGSVIWQKRGKPDLIWAATGAILVGALFTWLPPSLEWLELAGGIPAILVTFGFIVWKRGFTHEDRVLFRMKKDDGIELPPPLGVTPPGADPPIR